MGRVVLTHSTYIEGLIPILKKLSKVENIKTITPGVIKKTKGKSVQLNIRISTKIMGGYKLIARKGTSVQEVFVITTLDRSSLDIVLKLHCI